ncbi:tryptophan--tRNA ligase [Gehongia tenuis]|uniref:Tryptophan--tRNA ligase n=1 Tax=Gehongia tenuis TaxID=2763655 RepID=A0A926D4P8_9FIRM|nr:tryptophan--tRNA ligase [Gehongia tenuis]MBC8531384.1 tryptophan--tRNA ligase [Gehongia tenuis]
MEIQKKRIFSGIQPSGALHLGNYVGALRNWVLLQDEYDCYYAVVDLHSLTVRQEPKELRKRCVELMAIFLASGIDPDKCTVFFQSHVSAHAELAWILNCYTYMGELSRMTQFKDKSKKHADNINAGLFTYPVLMASDILLYQPDLVPVGQDQKQHVELCRDVAVRFNNIYGDVFTIPEPFIPRTSRSIKSLQDPLHKMSKSDDENSCIGILDEPDVIVRKIKRAVTDSEGVIAYREDKPGVSNLINIHCALSGREPEDLVAEFEGKGYGDLKKAVAEVVVESLKPMQDRYHQLIRDKAYMDELVQRSTENARKVASKTLYKVYRKVGLAPHHID